MTCLKAAYTVKPPTPLAVFATGRSDVQFALMQVSLGFDTVFEDIQAAAILSGRRIRIVYAYVHKWIGRNPPVRTSRRRAGHRSSPKRDSVRESGMIMSPD